MWICEMQICITRNVVLDIEGYGEPNEGICWSSQIWISRDSPQAFGNLDRRTGNH